MIPTVAERHEIRRDPGRRPRLVKLALSPAARRRLEREAEIYLLLASRCPVTAGAVASGAVWDADLDGLSVDVIEGANLWQAVREVGELSESYATAAGALVATLHEEGSALAGEEPPRTLVANFDAHRPGISRLHGLTTAGIHLLKMLQGLPELCARLDTAVARSLDETLIHGDLRFENFLVAEEQPEAPRLRLVDWEFAGWGEAAWDPACFIASGISAWLWSVPSISGMWPDRLLDEALIPLERLRPGLAAFVAAYRGQRSDIAGGWLERCMELAGTNLAQLAFEATQYEAELQPIPILHLQVALNILADPLRSARELLGVAA